MKTSKICDPLYDYIYLDQEEKSLVDHPIFQRLRSIQQLGFSEQAFPSGTGNRFSHSLGVCHLAGVAFDSIFNKTKSLSLNESKKQDFKKALRISALLHDIGHGPLSHSSETLMPPLKTLGLKKFLNTNFERQARHEDYSVKFIMEDEGLYKTIKQTNTEPSVVAQLLHEEFSGNESFFIEGGLDFLPLLRQIINSDFDVDRMDYLQRDSLYCGVKYGLIDFAWLISHFDSYIKDNQVFLAIGKESLYTLESFILGRQHMRLIVYFHHKSAIYNEMLKKYAKDCNWKLPSVTQDYLEFTDSKLFDRLKSESNEWAERIIKKNPYLRLYEHISFESSAYQNNKQFILSLQERLQKEEINFIDINSEKHSIKPSKNISEKYSLYLKNKVLNQTKPLYKDPALLSLPTRKIERIYVQPEQFSKAKSLLKDLI